MVSCQAVSAFAGGRTDHDRDLRDFGGVGGTYEGGSIDAASNPVSLVMLDPGCPDADGFDKNKKYL